MRKRCTGTARFGTHVAAWALALLATTSHAYTGICPDGSIFIAPEGARPPCRDAKEVESSEVPPIKPEYLPHPHTWTVYQDLQDPNNPYNLIDSVREIRALHERGGTPVATPGADPSSSAYAAHTQPFGGLPSGAVGPLDLGLLDEEIRSLYQLVELSQEVTPAAFERRTADGEGVFRVSLARSLAFEDRLGQAWSTRGGIGAAQVVVFTAVSMRPEPFHANLTFVQGHLSFQPAADNPRQLGVLQGHLGDLEADEVVLGYVILPETLRADHPMDVYWNDRRISVAFP